MKIIYYIIFCMISISISSHEISLEDKDIEKIINERMKHMSNINKLSQKIYKQINSDDYEILHENIINLKHSASKFQMLFPPGSQGGSAKNLIWEDTILFEELNKKFLYDIDSMLISLEDKDNTSLKENFENMTSNCGSCHKKFKNKK